MSNIVRRNKKRGGTMYKIGNRSKFVILAVLILVNVILEGFIELNG